jgi:DNA-binding beta-propeller fold protein YncE
MNRRIVATRVIAVFCCLALLLPALFAADPIEFVPAPGFPQVPAGVTLGKCSAVAIDSHNRIFVFHRGRTPILCFDREGSFVRGWGDDAIQSPHGIRIDSDDNIWTTDTGHHLVLKFSPQGKLLLALGTSDKPGDSHEQFNKPTDVAFGPAGEVYVSDGYGNNRIVQFDARGKFAKTWGRGGKGPGEFNLPHAVRVDSRQQILVGDRENKRIQVFDRDGKVLAIWEGFAPYGLEIDQEGAVFVADAVAHRIVQLDADGRIVHSWGNEGSNPGEFKAPHMLATNGDGSLFVAEVDGMRVQKFVRKRK